MRTDPCEPERTSPVLLATAVGVIVLTAVGIGAATGVIPNALSDRGEPPLLSMLEAPVVTDGKPCFNCGVIASIRAVELRQPLEPSTDGPRAEPASTILGVAGGIFTGPDMQRTMRKRYAYRITIRMDDGSYRTFSERTPPRFAVGEKVRVVDGTLAANS